MTGVRECTEGFGNSGLFEKGFSDIGWIIGCVFDKSKELTNE